MSNPAKVSLRPVRAEDEEFLLSVYASTRAEELARVPWTPEQKAAFVRMQFTAQREHYASIEPQANHDVILRDGVPVGRLYLARNPEALKILDITILPHFRGSGIGAFVLGEILEDARVSRKPVTIYVEFFNPSVRLFERLGFHRSEQEGIHILLKYAPSE